MSQLVDIDPAGRARGLRWGIAAVVAAAIVSMWAGVVISIDQSRDTARKDMAAAAANLAFAFDEEVTHTLDNIAGTMDAVANRMRAEAPDMNIYAWSRQFPIVAGPIAGVGIVAPNGMLVAETGAAKSRPVDLSQKTYFRAPIDRKFSGLFIGSPVKAWIGDPMLIPIAKRIETRGGRVLGVLVFLVSPAKLTRLYRSIDLGENGRITLIGRHGVILSRFSKDSADGLDGIGESIAGRVSPEGVAENSQGSYVETSATDHVKRLFSYRRGADYPLVVSVGLDYESGLALAQAHAVTMSALAAVATLLLAGLACYLIREIGGRAKRDIELAAERSKLHAANLELQSANAELTASKQAVEVASQAKSLFLANMSHELRTPLNAIIGFSQLIRDHAMGPGKPVYADYASDIFGAGEHLLEIINNLLDISKIEAGKTEIRDETIELVEILSASRAAVRVQAQVKSIELVLDVPRGIPRLRGDALRLRQVFINLLSNAVKFTEAGQVTVTAVCDAAHGLTVMVIDTGIGMSEDEIAIALEPFGQVENAITKRHEGTGLGLSIARRLVELHGGRLAIASVKGSGTTISVHLPAERLVLALAEVGPEASAGRALSREPRSQRSA
ncbi:MAG TPA: ATP-binding protein [Stellaceae bacterium]|nr:ATP-binding protein [Stellaceae bacterium]